MYTCTSGQRQKSRHIHTLFAQPPCNDDQPVQGQRAGGEKKIKKPRVKCQVLFLTAYLEDFSSPGGCSSPFDVNLSKREQSGSVSTYVLGGPQALAHSATRFRVSLWLDVFRRLCRSGQSSQLGIQARAASTPPPPSPLHPSRPTVRLPSVETERPGCDADKVHLVTRLFIAFKCVALRQHN